jgi:hypothetical protein
MKRIIIKSAPIYLVLAMSIINNGCTPVRPWERGNLAKSQMSLEPNPMQSVAKGHIYSSREAAVSGNAAQGGGCGCY